jgi:hypothetical protein
MMPIKFVGKSFSEEVESLVGTLINMPFAFIRPIDSPFILHFNSEAFCFFLSSGRTDT